MSTLVLEINDAGLIASDGEQIHLQSPGYAVVEKGGLVVGAEALNRSRLNPRATHNRFWAQLNLDPLFNATAQIAHHGDLTYHHLDSLWHELKTDCDELLLTVPGSFTSRQLGLLLGIAQRLELPVRGLVDTAVAAAAQARPPAGPCLHLEIHLHQVTGTRMDIGQEVTRISVEEAAKSGLAGLREHWAELIADSFMRNTRFDPLHDAGVEQALHNHLPGWLDSLRSAPSATLELEAGGKTRTIRLTRERLIQAAEGVYQEIETKLQTLLPSHQPGSLLIGARLAALPGLLDRLGEFSGRQVTALAATTPAAGALAHLPAIRSEAEALPFVTRLPMPAGAAAQNPTDRPGPAPSHLLYQNQAYPIRADGLKVGADLPAGTVGILLNRRQVGTVKPQCRIRANGGTIIAEPEVEAEVRLNEQRITQPTPLHLGDQLRIGSPGARLDLIAVKEHGA